MTYIIVISVVIILDAISKIKINNSLDVGEERGNGKIRLKHIKNGGGYNGFLENKKGMLFILSVMTIYLFITSMINDKYSRSEKIGMSLVIGGGISNIYERMIKNEVTDFIKIVSSGKKIPIFNIADISIFIGIIVIMISGKKGRK